MTITKTLVYLRADGDNKIGLGHIHRLLSLNEMLRDNFECKFITRFPLPGIAELIREAGSEIIELNHSDYQANEISELVTGKEIVVLDGYDFGTEYQQKIKEKGNVVVTIDDLHQHHFVSDVIINPAGNLNEAFYSKEKSTALFSGPKFSFLKKPFLDAAKERGTKIIATNSILICMGGADPDNHTLLTLQRCLDSQFTSYYIVIGEAYSHKERLNEQVKMLNRNISVLSNLKPVALAHVMKQCAVAVCSASGIAYEYLSVGGELYVKKTAENQSDLFNYLLSSKLAFDFKNFRVDETFYRQSIQKQGEVFDGLSGQRILKIFNRLDFYLHARMRLAKLSDLVTVFNWVNDPELREQSYNPNPITLEDHSTWFRKKIIDPATFLYIFDYKGIPIGQVRFDISVEATISYSLDRLFRGRGWGQIILEKAINEFQKNTKGFFRIIGYVKQSNTGSNMIFKNLNFTQYVSHEYPESFKYELISHD